MRKGIILPLIISILFLGCANRQANTVSEYQPGDREKSCDMLLMEINNLEKDMNEKWADKNNQTGANVALGVAGAFLLVPWFFMDLSGADKVEYESFKRRRNYLKLLLANKHCFDELEQITKREEEVKKEKKKVETSTNELNQ